LVVVRESSGWICSVDNFSLMALTIASGFVVDLKGGEI